MSALRFKTISDFADWLKVSITEIDGISRRETGSSAPQFRRGEGYYASLVGTASIVVAKFGGHDLIPTRPPDVCSREDAAWQLKRIAAWCKGQPHESKLSEQDNLSCLKQVAAWCERNSAPVNPVTDFLTVKQAADHLNVSQKTIYAACEADAEHPLKHTRVGQGRGTIRIKKSDLDDFKRTNSVQLAGPRDYLSE